MNRMSVGLVVLILLASSLVGVLFRVKPDQATAATPQLRVLSYNVNNEQDAAGAKARMQKVADYITQNKVEVAILVEMRDWRRDSQPIPDAIEDGAYLQQILQERQYPMERYAKPIQEGEKMQNFGNVILTRYAAVPHSYREFPLSDGSKRWVPSVAINSPIGVVRVLAVHTRGGDTVCPSLGIIDEQIQTAFGADTKLMAGGDWNNHYCPHRWEEMKDRYEHLCPGCDGIDNIIAPISNAFKVVGSGETGGAGISDHPAILVDLTLKDGQLFPNPAPQPIRATPSPSTPTTPTPASTVLPKAASDRTLPWSKNASQGVIGPTSGWTSQRTNDTAICNGKWCWKFDMDSLKWLDNGVPFNVQTTFQSQVKPLGSIYMWSNGGPTAGWEDYDHKYLSVANKSILWLENMGADPSKVNPWAQSGKPYDLPANDPWKNLAPATDGTQLLSGRGITAAWTDVPNGREYFCQSKWCWVFNYKTNGGKGEWEIRNSDGKGIPFDISTTFKVSASPNGVTIASDRGPNVAWTDPVQKRTSVCSGGWCWTYTHSQGSAVTLAGLTWDRSGAPYNFCVSNGGNNCPGATIQPTPTSSTQPTPKRGDFNKDGSINQTDANLLIGALGTQNATYDLTNDADHTVNLYDYNEWLKLLGT